MHLQYPFMGVRMLRNQLAREGIHVGRRHIATLMRRMGISALAPQPGTSKRTPVHKIYPYLLRKLAIKRSNQVWALDTTYIPMARGFVSWWMSPAAACWPIALRSRWRQLTPGR